MTRRNRLMTTLLTLATAATAIPALACPPGGRPYGGYSGGYSRPAPVYYSTQRYVRTAPVASTTATAQARAVADQAVAAAKIRATAAQAKAAFLAKNYGTALALMDQVVKVVPNNNEALQFRSLIRFAMADYKPAAADAYEAMKYGRLWTKDSIDGLYGDAAAYRRHLKALEIAAAEQPEALDVHFLLAYQKLMTGDFEAGKKELETVLAIKPAEPMAENLLKIVDAARNKETAVASDAS